MKKYTTIKAYKNMKMNIISRAMCLTTCVAFYFVSAFFPQHSFASNSQLVEKHAKDLSRIESYLNNIEYLSSNFTQKSADGPQLEGIFNLSRPGKMRIEYNDDPKILIIVNGSVLTYKDIELDETSYISTNTTPASFLTRKNISFSAKDIEVTHIEKSQDHIKVSVIKKNRKEAGEFSLIFATNPLKFVKMEVKNDLDQIVTVTLNNLDFSTQLSKDLFIIKNKNLPE